MRIQGYYRQRGFAGVKVTSQVERREPKAGSEFVRVQTRHRRGRAIGRRVGDRFRATRRIDSGDAPEGCDIRAGQPYFEPQIADDADSIALLYLNRGYPGSDACSRRRRAIGDGSKVELTLRDSRGPADPHRPRAHRREPAHVAATRFSAKCS